MHRIDIVFGHDESWSTSDCTTCAELNDWLGTLDLNNLNKLKIFLQTMQHISHTFKVTNPETKVESDVTLEGLSSFFE